MSSDDLLAQYEREALDPTALPPSVFLTSLPQAYRDYLQLGLERHGRMPGVIRRVMVRRSVYKSLALHGHHEDDAEEDKRKKKMLDRWLANYLAAEAMLWELLKQIDATRDELDAEIDNLNTQIHDLKALPETDRHAETLEQLEQDRAKLAKYRKKTDEFEESGLAAGHMASKSGVKNASNGFTNHRQKIANYLGNMRTQRHSAGFNTVGNAASAAAAMAGNAQASTPKAGGSPPAKKTAAKKEKTDQSEPLYVSAFPSGSGKRPKSDEEKDPWMDPHKKGLKDDDEDGRGDQSSTPGGP